MGRCVEEGRGKGYEGVWVGRKEMVRWVGEIIL